MYQMNCAFEGVVTIGKRLGRTIGFPTANLSIQSYPSLNYGVYGVTVLFNEKNHYGIMNVGIRPTFYDYPEISYEVHLFDFNQDIYDQYLKVNVCFYVRKELSFPNVNQLIMQINKDVTFVKQQFQLPTNNDFVYEKSR